MVSEIIGCLDVIRLLESIQARFVFKFFLESHHSMTFTAIRETINMIILFFHRPKSHDGRGESKMPAVIV